MNTRHDGSPFDLAVNKVLDDLSRNPSQFVDMLKSECALDYYDTPKGDALTELVHRQHPGRHEHSRALGTALYSAYLEYIAGKPQTIVERDAGKAAAYFAERYAVNEAENAGE